MKKIITINLGNKGTILSFKDKNTILDTIFIENFTQVTLEIVNNFFAKYKKYDAYIILDTVAQNYNYKIFPPLNYFDLYKLVNRRFNSEIPKSDLKQKKFLYKNNLDKRSVFLFVSASIDSPLKEWLNFFKTVPNNLLGIYMMPLESVEFAKSILKIAEIKKTLKEKNKWILITFNDQTSDLRQIAIFNNNIAFTRLISLESAGNDLAEFAKNDIIRTSEYIKRFDNEFDFDKLTIITILDAKNKNALATLKIDKSLILNFTPKEVAKNLNIGNNSIDDNEKYSDLLLTLFIFKNFRRIRFGNLQINTLYNFSIFLNILKGNIFLLSFLIFLSLFLFASLSTIYKGRMEFLNKQVKINQNTLQSKSEDKFGMNSREVDKIIDAGSIKDIIDKKYENPVETFQRLYNVQNDLALTYNTKWIIEKFDYQKQPNIENIIKVTYDISIINPDGDPNKLFNKYDLLSQKLREAFKGQLTGMTTLPNNINFSKKYLTYPLKVEITERK